MGFVMSSGRKPNEERRRLMTRLRAKGLSLQAIGERLGVSRQCVQQTLKVVDGSRLVSIRCRECGSEITLLRSVADNNGPVWCLACLAKHPKATFGQRLKAYRLAAGLTITALERRSGVGWVSLSGYECGRNEPKWQSLAQLIRVLGVEWLSVK